MITVGIIGFGLSGRYLQAPFFLTNPNFKLKTIVSVHQNATAVYPSVQTERTFESLLNDVEIGLISVCSPNETHFDYVQRALLADKHVLVEKPFVATAEQAETLIALARTQGKHLFVFQNRRFDSDFLTLRRVIENNLLGDILSFDVHFNRYKPLPNPKKWKEIAAPSTGILYDLGAHIIDQTIALFGVPQKISGETFIQRPHSEIDDAFDIRLDYGKIKVTLKSSLMVREDTPRYIVQGMRGSFVKHGIDVQEDHLKAGIFPKDNNFGVEPENQSGLLNAELNGIAFRGRVTTLPGNWHLLFQNIYDVITHNATPFLNLKDVVEQIRIMEKVKSEGMKQ